MVSGFFIKDDLPDIILFQLLGLMKKYLPFGSKAVTVQTLVFLSVASVIVYVVHSGIFKIGDARWIDARFFYIVGRCWLSHASPYDFEIFEHYWQEILSNLVK